MRPAFPPGPWNGSKDAEFGAIELEDGSLGLSYVLPDGDLSKLASGGHGQNLIGADSLDVAQRWAQGQGARRTIGSAAVNALTRHLFDRTGFAPPVASDSVGGLAPPGEHIDMIVSFPPLVKRMTACGACLTVLERKSELAGARPCFRVTLDPRRIETCDTVPLEVPVSTSRDSEVPTPTTWQPSTPAQLAP